MVCWGNMEITFQGTFEFILMAAAVLSFVFILVF